MAADVDPSVKRKEIDELLTNGRRLLAAAVRKLLEKIDRGDATAADLNAAAKLVALLGLDRVLDLRDELHAQDVRRALAELDEEERTPRGTPFDLD